MPIPPSKTLLRSAIGLAAFLIVVAACSSDRDRGESAARSDAGESSAAGEAQQDDVPAESTVAGGTISIVAGNGASSFTGDGGPAVHAGINSPFGIVFDTKGNMYFADRDNYRIRKIDNNGTISTIAGNGTAGSAGDGRPAIDAQFQYPVGLAFDDSGNLYVADSSANRIRMIDTAGIIWTYAGTGTAGFSGDGGPASTAELNNPTDVVFRSGNLYVSDTFNNRVRKIVPDGTISTIAGDGSACSDPTQPCGDGGPATSAQITFPMGLATDGGGSIHVASLAENKVRTIDQAGTISTEAGTGTAGYSGDGSAATAAELNAPEYLAIGSDGSLFISDLSNNRVRMVDPAGTISTVAGNGQEGLCGNGGPATEAQLYFPTSVAVGPDGSLYFGTEQTDRIHVVAPPVTTGRGDSGTKRAAAAAAVPVPAGDIYSFAGNANGGYCGDGDLAVDDEVASPSGLATDGDGNVYIADTENQRIRKVGTDGTISTIAGDGTRGFGGDGGKATGASLSTPTGVGVGSDGSIYIVDAGNERIRKVDTSGVITTFAGTGASGFGGDGGPATQAMLDFDVLLAGTYFITSGIAADAEGNVYFSDGANNRVRKVDSAGTISTVAGNGTAGFSGDGGAATQAELDGPAGLALAPNGALLVADRNNYRIRSIDVGASGDITTVAGSNDVGYAGDGGPATKAALEQPSGVAVDTKGDFYITSLVSGTVRQVDKSGIITTVVGTGKSGFNGNYIPANTAEIGVPAAVTVTPGGTIVVTNTNNALVQAVKPS